jgi:hypothetical protein
MPSEFRENPPNDSNPWGAEFLHLINTCLANILKVEELVICPPACPEFKIQGALV